MKNLLYIFFAIATLVIAPNAKADCTDVIVTYEGGEPSEEYSVNAWDVHSCQSNAYQYYAPFMISGQPLSFKNKDKVQISPSWPWAGDGKKIYVDLKGTPIHLVCTYDPHKYFKGCKVQ